MLNEKDDGDEEWDCRHMDDGEDTDIDGESDDEVELIGNFL